MGSRRFIGLIGLLILPAIFLQGCELRNRNQVKWYEKPPKAPSPPPFVDELINIQQAVFTATYSISGSEFVSRAEVAFQNPKALIKTNISGIDISLYIAPDKILACGSAGGLVRQCKPIEAGQQTRETDLLSPKTYNTLVNLFTIPGAEIVEKRIVGADALCLNAPKTELAPMITLCLAKAGGVLFYSNGAITIAANEYRNTVNSQSLNPPA